MFDRSKIKLSLNLVEEKDPRNWQLSNFITLEMRQRALEITKIVWLTTKILDQGNTPHCVGYAWTGFGLSTPVEDLDWDNAMGENIYYKAKEIDGEPGQENGSTTLSGVKAFTYFGKLSNYAFSSSVDDIIVWIKTTGPVVVGTNWYNDMFDPDSKFVVHATGGIAGGHEWMLVGWDDDTQLFRARNSWGTEFADSGEFFISKKDMIKLLSAAEQGDAVTAVEVPHDEPVPPTPEPTPDGCCPKFLEQLTRIADYLEKISKKRFHS